MNLNINFMTQIRNLLIAVNDKNRPAPIAFKADNPN
jgi:hypothetical protein